MLLSPCGCPCPSRACHWRRRAKACHLCRRRARYATSSRASSATRWSSLITETPNRTLSPSWQSALLALAAYAVFDLALPLVRVHPGRLSLAAAALLVIVPTAVFMLLQVW